MKHADISITAMCRKGSSSEAVSAILIICSARVLRSKSTVCTFKRVDRRWSNATDLLYSSSLEDSHRNFFLLPDFMYGRAKLSTCSGTTKTGRESLFLTSHERSVSTFIMPNTSNLHTEQSDILMASKMAKIFSSLSKCTSCTKMAKRAINIRACEPSLR